jgi:hypothetical protein
MARFRGIVVATIAGAGIAALAGQAAAVPAGHSAPDRNRCPSSITYLQAKRATNHNGVVTITGHEAYMFCDRDSEFLKTRPAITTFKVIRSAPIRVLRKPYLNPDSTRAITHRAFPGYVKHQQLENFYIYKGPKTAITRLTPGFQS